ncbi:hypothetical protein AB1K42_15340 [Roseibium algicola]|uniref:hypothetical protein n=1 Tax=Roseibium algicola TaxID=2857014 RepID=UPI003457587D
MSKDPAVLVVRACGGLKATAALVGKDTSSVFRWRSPKNKGGADGRVPGGNLFLIWCELIRRGKPISLEELVFTEQERLLISDLENANDNTAQDPRSVEFDEANIGEGQ